MLIGEKRKHCHCCVACGIFATLLIKLVPFKHTQKCKSRWDASRHSPSNDAVLLIRPLTEHQSSSPFVFFCLSFTSAWSELGMHIHLLTALFDSLLDCSVARITWGNKSASRGSAFSQQENNFEKDNLDLNGYSRPKAGSSFDFALVVLVLLLLFCFNEQLSLKGRQMKHPEMLRK